MLMLKETSQLWDEVFGGREGQQQAPPGGGGGWDGE